MTSAQHRIAAICLVVVVSSLAGVASANNMSVTFSVNEEMPVGTIVGILSAHKTIQTMAINSSINGNGKTKQQKLSFILTKPHQYFTVDETLGVIRTKSRLDRESLCDNHIDSCCHLSQKQKNQNQPDCFIQLHVLINTIKEFVQVVITVVDINDNAPSFTQPEFTTFVSEDELPGRYCLELPPAFDADSRRYAVQDYRLDIPSTAFHLRVNEKPARKYGDLCLLLIEPLDRERVSSYSLKVLAIDSGLPAKTGTLSVVVRVLDTNDNRPRFHNDSFSVQVAEDLPVNSLIIQLHATDADEGEHGRVLYSFVPPSSRFDAEAAQQASATVIDRSGPFYINSETGAITLDSQLNYEETRFYELRVLARDCGSQSPRFSTTSVLVQVTNVNDCRPEVELFPVMTGSANGNLLVWENEPAGTPVGLAVVTDKDNEDRFRNRPNCAISSPYFELVPLQDESSSRFEIVTRVPFDREDVAHYYVTMRCDDGATPRQIVDTSITIEVLDRDDNVPHFLTNQTTLTVRENNRVGTLIGKLNVSDADADHSVSSAEFVVASLDGDVPNSAITVRNGSGEVIAQVVFDRERRDQYRFQITIRDPKDSEAESSLVLTLLVEDENDETPVFEKRHYAFVVAENLPAQTVVGSVRAHDSDLFLNGAIEYSFAQPNPAFAITERGDLIATASLDREAVASYLLRVVATDNGKTRRSATAEVRVDVIDKNDNKPHFVWPTTQNNTLYVSYMTTPGVVGKVSAVDIDAGDNSRIQYSIVQQKADDDLLEIDPPTGSILLRRIPFPGADRKVVQLTVRAEDRGSPSQSTSAILNVQFVDVLPVSDQKVVASDSQAESFDKVTVSFIAGFIVLAAAIVIAGLVSICLRRSRLAAKRNGKHGHMMPSSSQTRSGAFSDSDRTVIESLGSASRSDSSSLEEVMSHKPLIHRKYSDEELTSVHMVKSTSTSNYRSGYYGDGDSISDSNDSNGSTESLECKNSLSDDCLPKYEETWCNPSPLINDFRPIPVVAGKHDRTPVETLSQIGSAASRKTSVTVYSNRPSPQSASYV